eukprot:scaffold193_cov239-Chaetoceros_neogracile.AAC.6
MRIFKNRPKLIGSFCVAAAYCVMVNHNVSQKAHLIERERALSTDLGGGNCVLNSPHKTTNGIGEKRTLLAGFPGSGKRFTYAVIEGLTDNRVADDWGFSGNDNGNIIKTSYPHPEGTWSYADGMDQSLLLIRNPRWAIPSYHNMKFELDFAMTWLDSYAMLPNVYTVRPSVASWETWRDEHALDELNKWVEFVDFWMTGGRKSNGIMDQHCVDDLQCKPKGILDFDTFYNEHPTTEFYRLGSILDATENVEVIARQARACILDSVYDDASLHNANRNGHGPAANQKRFSASQLTVMVDALNVLITKYSEWKDAGDQLAGELVIVLKGYLRQISSEQQFEMDMEQLT